jgi:putative cardiolipin synthase
MEEDPSVVQSASRPGSGGIVVLRPVRRVAAEQLARLKSEAVVSVVSEGLEAFAVRLWLARTAERTLDLQYYEWADDVTGRLLSAEVLKAADRGVRVRILLDDTTVIGRDKSFQIIDQHPNVEVRVFNATTWRAHGFLGFGIEFALGGWHLNHRMHNKAWIADGHAAVIGGRNIADRYFDGSGQINFRDLDLVVLGTPLSQATAIFETFWKSPVVLGVQSFLRHRRRRLRRRLSPFRAHLDAQCDGEEARPYLAALRSDFAVPERLSEQLAFDPVERVEVLSDDPEKANDRRAAMIVGDRLSAEIAAGREEVILISPYFVPGRDGTRLLEGLLSAGVRVKIVTNSLAATDVTAVHSGYARYRRRLLRAGAIIHELKRTPGERARVFGSGGASLHTKAVVVDRAVAFVGSFNLDHRSAKLNTEMGVLVTDRSFAQTIALQYERLTSPMHSYRVTVDDGRLAWRAETEGRPVVFHAEPDATLVQRIVATVVGWLPMEAQL